MSSVTLDGELFYWPFLGTMTAPTCIGFLEQRVTNASMKVTVLADRHPAHEAVGRCNRPAPGSRMTVTRSEQKITRYR